MSFKSKLNSKLIKFKYYKRLRSFKCKKVKSIAIIYYIPETNYSKYNNWLDGFTSAIDVLSIEYKISWINLSDEKPKVEVLNKFDFLIVKSCWDWIVDNYIRSLNGLTVPKGLAISCSRLPINMDSIYSYDVLWYETNWYRQFIIEHPRAFHAFGIITEIFKNKNYNKIYDVLSIGQLASYKRHEKIANIKGQKKIVIGDSNTKEGEKIKSFLVENNIEVLDFIDQESLSDYINKSKLVYIPASINGGGERAVLEARSCNAKILIEKDNPKLQDLLRSEIWDHNYYAKKLKEGILSINK